MRDYKELVSDLREMSEWVGPDNFELPITLYDKLVEAAEAIEDLLFFTRRLEELRRDGWHLQRTVSDMYGCCIQQMDIPKPTKEDDNA